MGHIGRESDMSWMNECDSLTTLLTITKTNQSRDTFTSTPANQINTSPANQTFSFGFKAHEIQ